MSLKPLATDSSPLEVLGAARPIFLIPQLLLMKIAPLAMVQRSGTFLT